MVGRSATVSTTELGCHVFRVASLEKATDISLGPLTYMAAADVKLRVVTEPWPRYPVKLVGRVFQCTRSDEFAWHQVETCKAFNEMG